MPTTTSTSWPCRRSSRPAARDVAAAFGATIEFLDAPYHRISDHATRVKDALAGILQRAPAGIRLRAARDRRLDLRPHDGRPGPPRRHRPRQHLRLQEPRPALPDRLDDARLPSQRLDRPAGRDRPAQDRARRGHDPRARGRVAQGPRRMGGQPGPPLRARHRLAVAPCRGVRCRVRRAVPPAAATRGAAGRAGADGRQGRRARRGDRPVGRAERRSGRGVGA